MTQLATIVVLLAGAPEAPVEWPPPLKGAKDGTVTLLSERFLHVPASVEAAARQEGSAPFVVARTPPAVDLAFHRDLGPDAVNRRLWSSWGDIALAGDGRVYCGIGDHGDDAGGNARCFLYRWDPRRKVLEQVVDMSRVVPPQPGQPAWSKVHARIDEGPDGKIYFSCTLNDGNRANQPAFHWTDRLPGGQLYRFDPQTGQTAVFADLPKARCTATSILDRERNVWWCNLEAGSNALWGLHLGSKRVVFQGEDGSVTFNRNFALACDGSVYFNGDGGIWKCDPAAGKSVRTRSSFVGSPGMRSSTRESKDGWIYGTTMGTGQLFRYRPAKDELALLGPAWLGGDYGTVCELSPDERFLYYLPGAHGGAFKHGTPVVQYEIATGRRKVLAFLVETFEQAYDYVPAGTYGMKVSADGGTLYVNFNGHAGDRIRPRQMKPNGFGLCGFAAIHIPQAER
jgi:sugar lactone lactonase YvrE